MTRNPNQLKVTSPTLHATIFFLIIVFTTSLVMAFIFKIEIVARGQGRVVPISRVQVLQPEYSGSITAIHVRNGSQVQEGDVLIELDSTEARTQVAAFIGERIRLVVEKARISALSELLEEGLDEENMLESALVRFSVPEKLKKHPVVAEERQLLEAEISDMLASFAQMDARDETYRRSEQVTKSNITRVNKNLGFQSDRLEALTMLLKDGAASQSAFSDSQQEYTDLEQERNVYLRELEQKMAERAALETERRSLVTQTRSNALQRRSVINARLVTLAEEQRAAARRVESATLRSPTTGTVDQLNVFTVGGVAEAEKELMRVVPSDVEIEIEALFSNLDIGFMSVGQQANIRLDAYPSERFGVVEGEVTDLAADSIESPDGLWGYRVRISPDASELIAGAERLPLRPGMTATVDVTTGKRRVISYFFAPIIRTIESSLGER